MDDTTSMAGNLGSRAAGGMDPGSDSHADAAATQPAEAGHNGTTRRWLVDTHCHLDATQFRSEPTEAILDRARQAGVARLVTIGTDVASSREAVRIAGSHQNVWAAVGIDPNDLEGFGDRALSRIDDLAASPGVVAIGEIGLDYYWDQSPRGQQLEAFRAQLELASSHGLPVVIHSRDATHDTVATLLDWASSATPAAYAHRPYGVMHCFSADVTTAETLVAAGFLISLAGNVTYKNATELHQVAEAVPDDALVLETDAPYLSPHPYRGRRNEPARVRVTAEFVAGVRNTSLADLAAITSANAARLFGWEDWPEMASGAHQAGADAALPVPDEGLR